MKVLFLTIGEFQSINQHGIYPDLLREFVKHGHKVYVVCARERRGELPTELVEEDEVSILKVKIGNITKTNVFEKGISTVLIEQQYKAAIKKYYSQVHFDLILYSTPPITFCKVVEYVKKRDKARTYLLLKDIFPQNAVDMGMLRKDGIKGALYRYFRSKEKRLYRISDTIGCMSEANRQYVLKHNREITASKVEICPNAIEPFDMKIDFEEKKVIRCMYNIPLDKTVFVYGGNLGKPQGIGFMLKCVHSQRKNKNLFFLIIGSGTEYKRIQHYMEKYKPENVALYQWVPKDDYDKVVAACDVGLIFLDHRFTIPNFPSRLLSYMSAKLPVLAVTDTATDVGKVIVEGDFGWWCESDDIGKFKRLIGQCIKEDLGKKGDNAFEYLKKNYDVSKIAKKIYNRTN